MVLWPAAWSFVTGESEGKIGAGRGECIWVWDFSSEAGTKNARRNTEQNQAGTQSHGNHKPSVAQKEASQM